MWMQSFLSLGPVLLFVAANSLLWNHRVLWYCYQVGIFTSCVLNFILKGLFKYPRPSLSPNQFQFLLQSGQRFMYPPGWLLPQDAYGFPSGHAQSAMFSTVFVHLALKKRKTTLLFFLATIAIMLQRVIYNHHTLMQVLAGALVGGIFAYPVYLVAQQTLKGDMRLKPDDNAFSIFI